jgi:hypothetical protein
VVFLFGSCSWSQVFLWPDPAAPLVLFDDFLAPGFWFRPVSHPCSCSPQFFFDLALAHGVSFTHVFSGRVSRAPIFLLIPAYACTLAAPGESPNFWFGSPSLVSPPPVHLLSFSHHKSSLSCFSRSNPRAQDSLDPALAPGARASCARSWFQFSLTAGHAVWFSVLPLKPSSSVLSAVSPGDSVALHFNFLQFCLLPKGSARVLAGPIAALGCVLLVRQGAADQS